MTATLPSVPGAAAEWPAERMPPIAPEHYTEAQKKAAAAFEAERKVAPFGPFTALLRSPELMNRVSATGQYLRYRSSIGQVLSELVILVTAREWTQDYEWYVHAPIALKVGIKASIVEAIRDGRRPTDMSEDEAIVYDFSLELHRNKRVSDATYARALKRFGEQGVIDLTGITGHYTFLSMQMNAVRLKPPPDAQKLPRFPE